MTKVIGTIESFKALQLELIKRRIDRFNSIEEVEAFLSGYDQEKQFILNDTKDQLAREYSQRTIALKEETQNREEYLGLKTDNLDSQISQLANRVDVLKHTERTNLLKRVWIAVEIYFKENRLAYLNNNRTELISRSVRNITRRIENHNLFIHCYNTELEYLIQEYAQTEITKLEHIHNSLGELQNLVAGAIGENLVVKELEKLSEDFVVFNDFRLNFDPPLYFRKTNSRITSIQIDHLLISKAGLFCIETKNWSESSIHNLSLRSPVDQIERSGFALFVYTSKNITLKNHHWGQKKIPVRNIVVMIKHKPQETFKFVSVKLLNELNDYITYFDPILDQKQFETLVKYFE